MPDDATPDALREAAVEYSTAAPTPELLDELYRQEVLQARQMPPEAKLLAGQELFEAACRITMAGIRNQFPEASEERCREILRERLEWRRRLEMM